ncbi:MAG: hypothetical protein IJ443_07190 [Firmicutes bacterium]|nr:hypothetical protein [Bacillota bacterium]
MNGQCNSSGRTNGNLVYLNKVYFDESQRSCPILHSLTTTDETFTSQLTFGQSRSNCGCECGCGNGCGCGCGCGCCDFTLNDNTTFRITDSRIVVTGFTLSEDSAFDAADVTVDGFPVTDLMLMNGQYIADLSGIMEDITDCPCSTVTDGCHCKPDDRCNVKCDNDGHFFLAQVPGPWVLGATIILEGTANNGSRTCTFRLCLRTIPGEEDPGIVIPGSDNFALYCVEIPCQTAGISPNLVFDFDACATLLNPVITADCDDDTCEVTLTATLVITPEINLKVTKPALFNLNATEVVQDCDNVGQCDLCDTEESCCDLGTSQTSRSQSHSSGQSRSAEQNQTVGQSRSTEHCSCEDNSRSRNRSGCGCQQGRSCSSCNNFTSTACQCCDTNGYTF